jgi:hypothetical protein
MKSKRTAGLFAAAASVLAAMALVAPVAPAATPAPGYSQFAGCPDPKTEFPGVFICLRNTIKSGHFQMGSKKVPIENPLTLSGGQLADGTLVANSKGGLSPVKQKVPGGVVGLTGLTWLLEFLGSEALTLYAQTELAGIPKQEGEFISLPIKVRLINGTLGNNCYVGGVTNPIKLKLRTGTTSPAPPNKPITGKEGEFSFTPSPEIFYFKNGTFVDNEFAAPGASGCVLTLFGFIPISINGLVNSQSGLPSPAGTNETIQNFDLEGAAAEKVYP